MLGILLILLVLILPTAFRGGGDRHYLGPQRTLEQLAEEGDRAKLALQLAQDPNRYLPTVQVGITLRTPLYVFGGEELAELLGDLIKQIPVDVISHMH